MAFATDDWLPSKLMWVSSAIDQMTKIDSLFHLDETNGRFGEEGAVIEVMNQRPAPLLQ